MSPWDPETSPSPQAPQRCSASWWTSLLGQLMPQSEKTACRQAFPTERAESLWVQMVQLPVHTYLVVALGDRG